MVADPSDTRCYHLAVRRISLNELRSQSAAVMDAVEAGETLIVTRHGVDVAEIRPVSTDLGVSRERLLQTIGRLAQGDHARQRAEAEEFFGEDRLSA